MLFYIWPHCIPPEKSSETTEPSSNPAQQSHSDPAPAYLCGFISLQAPPTITTLNPKSCPLFGPLTWAMFSLRDDWPTTSYLSSTTWFKVTSPTEFLDPSPCSSPPVLGPLLCALLFGYWRCLCFFVFPPLLQTRELSGAGWPLLISIPSFHPGLGTWLVCPRCLWVNEWLSGTETTAY